MQAIDRAPWPDSASITVDWVNLFNGAEPRARTQLKIPAQWSTRIRPEMVAAAQALQRRGADRVLVRGYMRLPLWFLAGAELPETRGHHVACTQRAQWWSSEVKPSSYGVQPIVTKIDQGTDLAVALAVTGLLGDDVAAHCKRDGVPVSQLLELRPVNGVGPNAIDNNEGALGWVHAVRAAVRTAIRGTGARRIHLFMSGLGGCALLLGHHWNRVAPTLVYEHLGGASYAPTFEVP